MRLFFIAVFTLTHCSTIAQSKIFNAEDTIYYSISYANKDFSRIDTIKIIITGNKWKVDNNQTEALIVYNEIDSSQFNGMESLGWLPIDTTGFVDNEKICWIHPPRHNHLKIMELSPFPRVHYPLEVDKKYTLMLNIGEGWGDLSFSQVRWDYRMVNEENGNWIFDCIATPENTPKEINYLTFIFNKQKGFIELNYLFSNGVRVRMRRIKKNHPKASK